MMHVVLGFGCGLIGAFFACLISPPRTLRSLILSAVIAALLAIALAQNIP